jgi:nicotinate phosphoribosyltransferase
VIKNTETNDRPTAKISDSPGKGMCMDDEFEAYLIKVVEEKIRGCHS